ncbi:MAG TPA: TetR/AcrR family transcriptional regulator [Candidatus Binatia bacterium]|jgi:AcrR family transcriptional regulator|nr:TetR/AcrR family transcriptional regulator [Candidatus Binatia bacterium]
MAAPARPIDGRIARSVRARAAIVEALLDLIEGGDLRPSAARVAERAGVSLRSVFQHFSDVESLFAAAADIQTERLLPLVKPLSVDGSLATRITAFVVQRTRVLEVISPARRAALLSEPFSREIQTRLRRFRADKAAAVRHLFASELAARPAAERRRLAAALVAAGSWSYWQALREHQGLSRAQAAQVVHHTLTALLEGRP